MVSGTLKMRSNRRYGYARVLHFIESRGLESFPASFVRIVLLGALGLTPDHPSEALHKNSEASGKVGVGKDGGGGQA